MFRYPCPYPDLFRSRSISSRPQVIREHLLRAALRHSTGGTRTRNSRKSPRRIGRRSSKSCARRSRTYPTTGMRAPWSDQIPKRRIPLRPPSPAAPGNFTAGGAARQSRNQREKDQISKFRQIIGDKHIGVFSRLGRNGDASSKRFDLEFRANTTKALVSQFGNLEKFGNLVLSLIFAPFAWWGVGAAATIRGSFLIHAF